MVFDAGMHPNIGARFWGGFVVWGRACPQGGDLWCFYVAVKSRPANSEPSALLMQTSP